MVVAPSKIKMNGFPKLVAIRMEVGILVFLTFLQEHLCMKVNSNLGSWALGSTYLGSKCQPPRSFILISHSHSRCVIFIFPPQCNN